MAAYDEQIQQLMCIKENTDAIEFVRLFLQSYKFPKATIARLIGKEMLSPDAGLGVSSKIMFVYTTGENLYTKFDQIQRSVVKNRNYHFIVLFNGRDILALDAKANDWLYVSKCELYKKYEFFLPLMGIEKVSTSEYEAVSVKIGEIFAQLYNELLILNPGQEVNLNKLFINVVACYFSESLGLMDTLSMKHWILTYSKENGSDLSELLWNVFQKIGTINYDAPEYIVPRIHAAIEGLPVMEQLISFDESARNLLVKLSDYNWSDIEPEVLGALIQSIITPGENSVAYNYTNTANVYKVIGPLFMDDLYRDYEELKENAELGLSLLDKLSKLRIFDISCGAGNFLIVSYKGLKSLEAQIKERLLENNIPLDNKEYITTDHFFGIDENETAIAITQLGLLFTELKSNTACTGDVFTLPSTTIVSGSALRYNWDDFCPKENLHVFLIGNPPYKGARKRSDDAERQSQMLEVFSDEIANGMKIGDLDYASGWFMKASKYIRGTNNGFAFVTTNSLTQGIHVPTLWPEIFDLGINISFAHTRFKWKNEGRNTTAVTVVIIGCRTSSNHHSKTLYDSNLLYDATDISPYLTRGNAIVKKESRPISHKLPKMVKGNMAYAKELFVDPGQRDSIVSIYPEAKKFFKRVVGAQEYIHHEERWCLWISDETITEAEKIPMIVEILDRIKEERLGKKNCPPKLLDKPYSFRETNMPNVCTLVIPAVSSENRSYFQIGYVSKKVVVTNLCFAIYDAEPWVFGIIASKMHNLWARTVCGGLESRPRYSNVLGYNTFPIPEITDEQKAAITEASLGIIIEREQYPDKNLMQLYNNDTMPEGLKYAHNLLDTVIESCYNPCGFQSDQERLDTMFMLYKTLKGV